jgi:hypothetical protein
VNSEILAAIAAIHDEMRDMRADFAAAGLLKEKTWAKVHREHLHALVCEIAGVTGPINWQTAGEVKLILDGNRDIPKGHERTVCLLQKDTKTPRSRARIWGVIGKGLIRAKDMVDCVGTTALPPSCVSPWDALKVATPSTKRTGVKKCI